MADERISCIEIALAQLCADTHDRVGSMLIACPRCRGHKTDGDGHLCKLCNGSGETVPKMEAMRIESPRQLNKIGQPYTAKAAR
ncbi:MAG TPA: hypothetical protein VJ728_02980 [Candidatus Binataceae bacterium]|nr:hypothetical protein [Candidatus Binataceae bacterium]